MLATGQLCFTRPRRTGIPCICPGNILGRYESLCVSTTCTVTQDLNKNSFRKLHITVNSPNVHSSSVVPNFVKPVNRDNSTSQVTSKQKNAQTTSVAGIPSPVGSIVSLCILCMDIISKSISDQTFSNETYSCIAAPIISSTSAICDSKWSIFSCWCVTKGRLIHSVNVIQIAEFLFEKQKVAGS